MDAIGGHRYLSFLDAFQGYHQINLAPEDQEKTAFITPGGNYHYMVMPFGLKNARAMYQRMLTRMFSELISKTMEVYINDMVVKTKEEGKHACDLQSVFNILKQNKLRLNVGKCAFGVGSGKFLGYMTTTRGVKP